MIPFLLVAGLLTVFAIALMVPVLWRGQSPWLNKNTDDQEALGSVGEIDRDEVNIAIAKEQLDHLDQLRTTGSMTDAEYQDRRLDIEKSLASSLDGATKSAQGANKGRRDKVASGSIWSGKLTSLIVALFIPMAAGFTYWKLGAPETLDPEYIASRNAAAEQLPAVEDLLPRLEAHLADNPKDLKGWNLLGVTYFRLQRFSDAANALTKASELDPANPDLLLQLADAQALANDGNLSGKPEVLIRQALTLRPGDPRGLWMLGMLNHQQGDIAGAISQWKALLPALAEQPQAQSEVRQMIAEAEAELSGSPASPQTSTTSTVSVTVTLSEELANQADPSDIVYIYAKAHQGPPMPLAVVRITVADLPYQGTLDDTQAMVPGMTLSTFSSLTVGARISFSGDPIAKSGDLFGEIGPVSSGEAPISISISQTVP